MVKTDDIIVSTEKKVNFLSQPCAYPGFIKEVRVKETHMSWVFLVNDFVYKLKKPVNYRFLDLRTLDSRWKNCYEEVRLNKRLAGNIYIGIAPLTVDEKGLLALEGKGNPVEWLIKMRRIPEESMLDYAIRTHTVNETRLKHAATFLSEFYKKSPGIEITPAMYKEKLKEEIQSTHKDLVDPAYKLPLAIIDKLAESLLQFLADHEAVFDERVACRKIIEAHGDLRPEHICLAPLPAIIDCLEFNRELRVLDSAEELSFLAMECEMMGDQSVEKIFFEVYAKVTSDCVPASLIIFYKLKRAFLRVFLVARHILEPVYRADPKWIAKASAYLKLARRYQHQLQEECKK